jgi:hypothetical protein
MFHEELAGIRCFPFIFLKGLAPKVVDWYVKQTGAHLWVRKKLRRPKPISKRTNVGLGTNHSDCALLPQCFLKTGIRAVGSMMAA